MEGKILIVDDDIDTLQLVGTMLEKQGFQIIAASNGEQAIEKAQAETPDLLILDVMMPGMNGYEVTKQLRSMPETAFIPIILFTAKSQVDDKIVGFESGADDYLTKPTHPAELIARVRTILNRPKTGGLPPLEAAKKAKPGLIYGVIGSKGGLGVSTFAVNLAVSLHQQTGEYVTLGELRPGQGSVGLMLGYPKTNALNNLLSLEVNKINTREVEHALVTHGTGIQLLLASYVPQDIKFMPGQEHTAAILKNLEKISPYTVLDLGSALTESTQEAVKHCDKIFLVLEPMPATLLQSKEMVANLEACGVDRFNIKPVLINRVRMENTVSHENIQRDLGIVLAGVITPAPELAYQAAMLHQPMIVKNPDSITFSQIKRLTTNILNEPVITK